MDFDKLNPGAPVLTTTERRAVLNRISDENAGISNAIITRGFLRLEVVAGNKNRYQFAVIGEQGDPSVRASERRLSRADAFYVDDIALVCGRRILANPAGSWEPHTFANPLVFPGAIEQPALATIMNSGKLSVTVAQTTYLTAWDVMAGRFIGPAQQGLLNGVAGAPYLADSWDRDKIFSPQTPTFRLNGGSTNTVELWVDEPINATSQDADEENVLALIFHGWYAANCGSFNPVNQ